MKHSINATKNTSKYIEKQINLGRAPEIIFLHFRRRIAYFGKNTAFLSTLRRGAYRGCLMGGSTLAGGFFDDVRFRRPGNFDDGTCLSHIQWQIITGYTCAVECIRKYFRKMFSCIICSSNKPPENSNERAYDS
ncbi:hypothetical protein CEXT_87081 [Caerostris extrusa]|uniref:Uncharacterized protein n=1 Tax=Caerostris extrusa TaxID=172846 RepID=A0AAV4NYB5_CAEEX|nr:hypothetical protein CEXT_87081 [Caerostris extrusa]